MISIQELCIHQVRFLWALKTRRVQNSTLANSGPKQVVAPDRKTTVDDYQVQASTSNSTAGID